MTDATSLTFARLQGSIRPYAWGSRTSIARLQGRAAPTATPEAELWLGAHASAPALAISDGSSRPLDELIADDPSGTLGDPVVARFGPRLPFLLKVLAVEQPLSLQVHPSPEQAAAGFRAEDARGIPLSAPERNYRDPWPKPELLCALTPVDALCGFRDPVRTCALLDELAVPELGWLAEDLSARGDGALAGAVRRLLLWPEHERAPLVAAVVAGARSLAASGGVHAEVADWIATIGARYPGDPGVVVALLLHLVHLRPGEAIHLPAGNLHAYLRGTGVEIMAASDNVLRGGLTAKHVDVEGLLHVLDAVPLAVPRVPPVEVPGGQAYPTPAAHFALERLTPGDRELPLDRRGPEILLAVGSPVEVRTDGQVVELASGQAGFVPVAAGAVTVRGRGQLFRATVGALPPQGPSGRAGIEQRR